MDIINNSVSRRNFVGMSAALLGAAALGKSALAQESVASDPVDASTSAETIFTPGTYTATGVGRNGDQTIEVTFSENAIESIEVTETKETLSIGGQACDALIDEVLTNQTVAVDNISGATFSCNAFITALKDCFEQAGGTDDVFHDAVPEVTPDYVTSADLVIIGAGGAGLSAALTAAQAGAEVILLEKGEIVGGNSNCCFSGILACDSQTQADLGVEGATAQAMKELQTNELAREDLVDAYVAASGETADWFTSLGVEFSADDKDPLQLTATSPVAQTSNTLVHVMYDAIREYDTVHLYFDTEATELVQDADGTVTGVKATVASGDELTFSGTNGVILTCGGYGKNHDLVVEYRPDLANAVTDEIAPTTGDGLKMGTAVGGVLVDMDQVDFFNHVVSGYSMLFDVPGGMNTPSGIYTNVEGKRFIDETTMIPNQYFEPILEQTDGKIFQICPVQDQVTEQVRVMLYYHMAQQADSVEELADDLGIDTEGLVETVNAWNEDIADGKDDEMGREENLVAIEGEVMGYQFGEAAHFFMGGLLFNTKAQIVDENENPIPGLYGAGEVTGGMQGTTRVSGTGLMDGLIFGRIAAKTALGE